MLSKSIFFIKLIIFLLFNNFFPGVKKSIIFFPYSSKYILGSIFKKIHNIDIMISYWNLKFLNRFFNSYISSLLKEDNKRHE